MGGLDLSQLQGKPLDVIQGAIDRCGFDFTRMNRTVGVTVDDLSPPDRGADADHEIRGYTDDPTTTLGLFYPEGRIEIDSTLIRTKPVLAQEAFLAEAAHAVDEFYMTEQDRQAIIDVVWDGTGDRPGWWEGPYEAQIGEVFMEAFIRATSDMGGRLAELNHNVTAQVVDAVRQILQPNRAMNLAIRRAVGR